MILVGFDPQEISQNDLNNDSNKQFSSEFYLRNVIQMFINIIEGKWL